MKHTFLISYPFLRSLPDENPNKPAPRAKYRKSEKNGKVRSDKVCAAKERDKRNILLRMEELATIAIRNRAVRLEIPIMETRRETESSDRSTSVALWGKNRYGMPYAAYTRRYATVTTTYCGVLRRSPSHTVLWTCLRITQTSRKEFRVIMNND